MAYKYIKCKEEEYADTLNEWASQGYVLVDLKIVNGSSPREHQMTLLLDTSTQHGDSDGEQSASTLSFDPNTGEVSTESHPELIAQGINKEGEVYGYKEN